MQRTVLGEAGFAIDDVRDVTDAVASVSETFGVRRVQEAVHTRASEQRLSRFCYRASKRWRPAFAAIRPVTPVPNSINVVGSGMVVTGSGTVTLDTSVTVGVAVV